MENEGPKIGGFVEGLEVKNKDHSQRSFTQNDNKKAKESRKKKKNGGPHFCNFFFEAASFRKGKNASSRVLTFPFVIFFFGCVGSFPFIEEDEKKEHHLQENYGGVWDWGAPSWPTPFCS